MSIAEQKTKLRQMLLDKRKSLSLKEIEDYSNIITKKLIETIRWEEIKNIHMYQSISSKNEIDTLPLIDWVRANHPEIEITLAPSEKPFDLPKDKSYDLVIVPVLGFDRSGNRLGYGGGYYDKLLANNNCENIIGLAYSLCEVEKLPTEDHDQKLGKIITESQIVET